jgi:hypothetical protein
LFPFFKVFMHVLFSVVRSIPYRVVFAVRNRHAEPRPTFRGLPNERVVEPFSSRLSIAVLDRNPKLPKNTVAVARSLPHLKVGKAAQMGGGTPALWAVAAERPLTVVNNFPVKE